MQSPPKSNPSIVVGPETPTTFVLDPRERERERERERDFGLPSNKWVWVFVRQMCLANNIKEK